VLVVRSFFFMLALNTETESRMLMALRIIRALGVFTIMLKVSSPGYEYFIEGEATFLSLVAWRLFI
jgi:hypothetical protein